MYQSTKNINFNNLSESSYIFVGNMLKVSQIFLTLCPEFNPSNFSTLYISPAVIMI